MPRRVLEVQALDPVAYRPLSDYGAIGDGRSVALVSRDGSIDWWCPGRFDAPSVFGALLDARTGGRFSIRPAAQASVQASMRYVPDTNVLETTHTVGDAVVRVRDHAPFPEDTGVTSSILVRSIVGVRGTLEMEVVLAPRFQYGRVAPRFSDAPHQITLARGAGEILMLRGIDTVPGPDGSRVGRIVVREGERIDLALRHRSFDTPVPFRDALAVPPADLEDATIARWRAWSERTRIDGPDAPLVRRAALALKLLQYAPTGAIVAAPTTSLPEEIGGVRNWDYRFAWIRDGALCAEALAGVGHGDDCEAFASWLAATLADRDLRILYTVAGGKEIPETEIAGLEGYRRSAPVRIGNGAATQRQLDVYGELFAFAAAHRVDDPRWGETLASLAEWVAAHWREPDSGIWEMRSEPRHFVLSKAMAWVALTKAAALARAHAIPGDADAWEREAARIREDVLANGVDDKIGFMQAYGSATPDASNLLLALSGFVDAGDPVMLRTVDAVLDRLTANGLLYRYLGADDGLPGHEATFSYCAFWLVEVLAKQGRVRDARALFDRMTERATPLGLYAEEIGASNGEHLGNFPQGFPHAGLIQAALALREAERRLT